MRNKTLKWTVVFFAASLVFCGCGRREAVKPPKVMLIGLDGSGWNFINPLLEEGVLPNFKAIIDSGSTGELKTFRPVISAVIWTSIATGKSVDKHGISDWTFKKEDNVEVPFRQNERRAKSFWNILGDRDRTVGVINWFITFPPEPVNGYMVSEEFRNIIRKKKFNVDVTYPKELVKIIETLKPGPFKKLMEEESIPDFREGSKESNLAPHFPNYLAQDKIIENVSLYLLKNYPVDVFATYFRLIDVVSHFACIQIPEDIRKKCHDEEAAGGITPATREMADRAYSKILRPIYIYADRILGRLMAMADPGTTFIIVSDHSFEAHYGGYGHTDTPHIPHGIVMMKGPHIKKGYKIPDMNIYDVLPTLLHVGGLPAAKDMDGKVRTDVFDPAWLDKHQVKLIDTYEGKDSGERKKAPRDAELDKKLMEELRTLGYIK